MQIAANKVVTINYTLTDDQGQVIDSSEGREPLAYLQGASNIIPGLEKALEGKSTGDSLKVSVAPNEGYGERSDELVQEVPRNLFENADSIEPGMQFQAQSEAGPQLVTVVGVGDESVTIDANHPLAGTTLNFDVEVVDVRDATAEEAEHGHVHGPEGHEH
jgi:FKBP-type peptidyl-prolyl cis-trans isomerase SlyD